MFKRLTGKARQAVQAAVDQSPLLAAAAAGEGRSRFLEILDRYAEPVAFKAGDVIFREGDYGNVLGFLLEGSLREVVDDPAGMVDATTPRPLFAPEPARPFWRFWNRRSEDDIVVVDHQVRQTLPDVDAVRKACETIRLTPAGDTIIGALAVLTRSPFPRTVFAESPVRLLALHWRGMRDLMGLCDPVRRAVNDRCRARIIELIRSGRFAAPAFSLLPAASFDHLMAGAEFRFSGGGTSEVTAVHQGEVAREVFLIVSGFGRIRRLSSGQSRSVGFVRRGDMFGLAALAGDRSDPASPVSLDLLGNISLLALSSEATVEHCLPFLTDEEIADVDPAAGLDLHDSAPVTQELLRTHANEARLVDFLVDHHFVRGREAMVIDQARCVGCDACVRACADTHAGVPRFVRAGPARAGYAVANACMHCDEAPCLVNCPTDAIFRKSSGEIIVSESLCIGCGTCAVACPYDNIRLVEMGRDTEQKEQAVPVAVKCDLCIGTAAGPACVRACPHDAVARLDLTDHDLVPLLARGASLRQVRSGQR